ncbi:MAG: hypothetical protein QM664_10210 [Flavihumibacter sp.]
MLAKTIPFYFRQPSLESVSVADIKPAVEKYPYSATLQLLLLKKMQQENDPGQPAQWEKCSLYFPNPFLLQAVLSGYGSPTTLPAIPVVNGREDPEAEEEDIPLVGKVTISEKRPEAAPETAVPPVEEPAPATATAEPSTEAATPFSETTIDEREPPDDIVANVSSDEWNAEATQPPAETAMVTEEETADYIVASISSDEWNLPEAEQTTAETVRTEDAPATPAEESNDDLRRALLLQESPIPIPSLKDLQPEAGVSRFSNLITPSTILPRRASGWIMSCRPTTSWAGK